jgi:hypothetical protein
MMAMRRALLGLVAVLLALSVSGASALVIVEPCTGDEVPGQSDAACPPTCVTCGCCAQAVEPLTIAIAASPQVRVTEVAVALPRLPTADPQPIFHVPKPATR